MSRKSGVLGLALIVTVLWFCHEQIYGLLFWQKPGFELSASPESVVLYSRRGSENGTVITIKSINGYQGNLSVKVELKGFVIAGEIKATYLSNLILKANEQVSLGLTLYVPSLVVPGTYYAEIIVTDGELEVSLSVGVVVLQ
jgi:uncharacterized membrane protein